MVSEHWHFYFACRIVQGILRISRAFAADAKALDELRKPKFTSKYLINHVSEKLIPAVKEWEKQYQPPVIHLGRVLSVGDGIARVYGLKSVQVGWCCVLSGFDGVARV